MWKAWFSAALLIQIASFTYSIHCCIYGLLFCCAPITGGHKNPSWNDCRRKHCSSFTFIHMKAWICANTYKECENVRKFFVFVFLKRLSPTKQWAAFSLVQVHVYLITVKLANRLPLCRTKLLIFTVHSVEFPPALDEGLSVKGDWNCFQHRSCTVVTMVQKKNKHTHKSPWNTNYC